MRMWTAYTTTPEIAPSNLQGRWTVIAATFGGDSLLTTALDVEIASRGWLGCLPSM
jgi:hypothetical protein